MRSSIREQLSKVNDSTKITSDRFFSVMEKLRQDKKSKNMLASLNINKRKKQKMQDTVIKQLRGLIKDWSLLTQPHRRLSQDRFEDFLLG